MKHMTFEQLAIGTRFIPAYGHNGYLKTSETEAARLFGGRATLYSAPYHAGDHVKLYSEGHEYRTLTSMDGCTVRALADVEKGKLLGYVTVDETAADYRESFEVAAWYRVHKLTPGTYPVYSGGLGNYGVPIYRAEISTTITDACLVSLFGGVRYGSDDAGTREIGKADSYFDGNGSYSSREGEAPFEGRQGFTFRAIESAQ